MAETSAKTAAKPDKASPEGKKKPSTLRWLFGWVVVPSSLIGLLFLGGVHVGARHPDMFLTRAALWAAGGEAQLGPQTEAERRGLAHRLRLVVMPSKDWGLRAELDKAKLDELVAAGAGPSIEQLDCAAVCRLMWKDKHPDKEFLSAESCELKRPTLFNPGEIDCDAKVQR